MMVSFDHDDLQNFLGVLTDTDLPPARAEELIDYAIDMLNAHGADLSNMSGSAATKTVSMDGKERGVVLNLAAMLYRHRYVNPQQANLGPVGVGATGTTEQDIDRAAREGGLALKNPSGKVG
jgi:hypothetical protein